MGAAALGNARCPFFFFYFTPWAYSVEEET